MKTLAQTRANMVHSQLMPTGVYVPAVLAAFDAVPRERFVPFELQNVAYLDDNIRLANGAFLMTPSVMA